MGRLVSQWANGYLEREGLARLTISILVITTAGCLAYTWGYAEGVHNTRTRRRASSDSAVNNGNLGLRNDRHAIMA
ncbi:hypothetical protein OEZ85_010663 [Tetradesmus obliquus]|uniref:Uncharacterized protein n=1 Tax=Tetradesmus obliquus TaxID=3088 RepID=A0ABY8TQ22_TETOB|nr:hypothetical protein OEZ85_010663 [Tetradesmus obliquus]